MYNMLEDTQEYGEDEQRSPQEDGQKGTQEEEEGKQNPETAVAGRTGAETAGRAGAPSSNLKKTRSPVGPAPNRRSSRQLQFLREDAGQAPDISGNLPASLGFYASSTGDVRASRTGA